MASLVSGISVSNGTILTPAILNANPTLTAGTIVNADISTSAAIADTKLATISTAGKVNGSAITSGNISLSGTITATSFVGSGASLTGITIIPPGAVMPFAGPSTPSGWLLADGSVVSRTTYLALFQAIGTNYGAGNGSTTFQIPDLRGYFIRGYGVNADGTTSGAFAAKQGDIFAAHTHVTTSGGDNGPLFALQGGGHSPVYQYTETTSTGGTETRPKNIALVYCIKT